MLKCDKCIENEADVKVEKNVTSKKVRNFGSLQNEYSFIVDWGYVGISAADPGHYCGSCFEDAEEESCSVSVRYGGK